MDAKQTTALQTLVDQLPGTPAGAALDARWPGLIAVLNFFSANASLLPQLIAALDALFPKKLTEPPTQ